MIRKLLALAYYLLRKCFKTFYMRELYFGFPAIVLEEMFSIQCNVNVQNANSTMKFIANDDYVYAAPVLSIPIELMSALVIDYRCN